MPQKIRCKVDRIVNHGDHVYTLELKPERPVPNFLPGQFMHLAIDSYEPGDFWPESRVFSIASSHLNHEILKIVYSVKGHFTKRMEDELAVGKNIWVKLPYGEFIINGSADVALFAGGTGVSAFTAFLESLSSDFPHKVYLFYGARNASLLLYRDFAEKLAMVNPQLESHYFAEEVDSAAEAFINGHLSIEKAFPFIQNPQATTYYLSGPPLMIETLRKELSHQNVNDNKIKIDSWG
jgi:NAD(P)H-flavin reductase